MKRKLLVFVLLLSCCRAYSQIPPYYVSIFDSAKTEGYYFLMPSKITNPNTGYHSQLVLDRYGDVVYFKGLGTVTNTPDFKVQPNGMITYFKGQKFYVLDSTFTIVDSVVCKNGVTTDSHDLQILPNGHFLLLGYENVVMNLSAYTWFKPSGVHGSSTANVKCNVIQEQDANHNVVFEWHTKNYFSFADADSVWFSNPFTVDWTHSNTVELDNDGNILLSCRHFDEITKINRTDSTIMWRMGGVQNQFTFLNDTTPFYGQHDVRRLPNGHVTLLDDGFRVSTAPYHAARALEYQLDEANKTATLYWSYVYDSSMYTKATGNVQRLPNGNTLVNYGNIASKNVTFVVVDSLKNKIFEIAFYDTMASYRSFNFQQLPWMFHRPEITCVDSVGTYYLDAGAGYTTYSWNTGDTNRFIPVSSADTFFVFVPYGGDGGYISAEKFIVTNALDPCGLSTSVSSMNGDEDIKIYPNPVREKLEIGNWKFGTAPSISIYNMLGEIVLSVQPQTSNLKPETSIDVRALPAGIYFLRITSSEKTVTTKLVKQ